MTSPILAFRAAILGRCGSDPELASLMGGSVRFYDEPPRAAEPVYALFGPGEVRDASVDLSPGHEQDLAVLVWAKPGSARTAIDAGERIAALVDDAGDLPLAGHRLVNIRVAGVEVRRDERADLAVVTVRIRAVTEVA